MLQLHVDLKSFDYFYIKTIEKFLRFWNKKNNKKVKGVHRNPMPTIIKKYTLLRSPHIDKKSREQFELRQYKTQILIQFKKPKVASKLIYLLKNSLFKFKNSLFPGVEVQVLVHYSCSFIKN